jgi:ABC-2 type transport system ATP-binding protein
MGVAIDTRELRKVYGDFVAVRGLTLQVHQGEVFGFLGPNGAGKTTSIKMLLGLASPTSGSARVLQKDVGDSKVRSHVGFLPEHFRFHEWLTAAEFLTLHGSLYGMRSSVLKQRVPEMLELVGLSAHATHKLSTFSKGMLQRIGLAQSLLNDPEVVFLDEPTSGLDPVGRRLVRDVIHKLKQNGTTVFLNSHLLSEVEITCDRVAFIKHGEVLRVDELSKLPSGPIRLIIRAQNIPPEVSVGLERWGKEIKVIRNEISMSLMNESTIPQLTRYLVSEGVEIFSITPQNVSLEDLFLEIIGTDGGL